MFELRVWRMLNQRACGILYAHFSVPELEFSLCQCVRVYVYSACMWIPALVCVLVHACVSEVVSPLPFWAGGLMSSTCLDCTMHLDGGCVYNYIVSWEPGHGSGLWVAKESQAFSRWLPFPNTGRAAPQMASLYVSFVYIFSFIFFFPHHNICRLSIGTILHQTVVQLVKGKA